MPKSYIGFQGGNRRRRRIAALYDAWFIRIQSGRGDTLQQTVAEMRAAEARRSDLISTIDLRAINGRRL